MRKRTQKKSSLWVRSLALVVVTVALSAVAANADIITYQDGASPTAGYTGSQDGTIYITGTGTTSLWGASPEMYIGGDNIISKGRVTRSLVRHDIDPLPAGQTLVRATLKLYMFYTTNAAPMDISAYQVLKDWNEVEMDWYNAKTSPSLAWQTGGADGTSDRKQTAEDTVAVGVTGVWYEWDLTALAAQWLAGTADNYGVILISDVEGQQADKVFCTNERAAEHPILELEYVPEPVTAITLLVGGLVALVSRTRRRRK